MKKRVDSLTRIGKLASQMHDLGRLAAFGDPAGAGEPQRRSARRVRGAGERRPRLWRAGEAQRSPRPRPAEAARRAGAANPSGSSSAAHAHGMRAKLAEQAAETADKVYREREARKELAELIERDAHAAGRKPGVRRPGQADDCARHAALLRRGDGVRAAGDR